MIHAHLKDAARDPKTGEMDSVEVGTGIIDWQGQLQAFIDDGYQGHLTLETQCNGVALQHRLCQMQVNFCPNQIHL